MRKIRYKALTGILAVLAVISFTLFAAACNKQNVTFNVADSYNAEQGTIFTFPALSAVKENERAVVAVAVKDADGNEVEVINNSFFVEKAENYTAEFSAFNEKIERTVYVTASENPEIWVQCGNRIPVQGGRPYIFDTSRVLVTEGAEVRYGITQSDGSAVSSETDGEGNLVFTPQNDTEYLLKISAVYREKETTETITLYGVDRSDNVIADFEEDADMDFVASNEEFPVDISLSQNFARSGSNSVRMNNLDGANFPRMEVRPGANITADPDTTYKMVFWFYLENPDNEPVGMNLATVNGNRSPDLYLTGQVPTGEWTKVEYELKGSEIYNFGIYMFNWQAGAGVPVSPSINLFIDDIYLEPQIEGKSMYWKEKSETAVFDIGSELTGKLMLGGHAVYNEDFRITKDNGSGETEVEISDGKLPLDEVAIYRMYPENVTGEAAYVVRVLEELDETEVPYADCSIPEDLQQFDSEGAFAFVEGLGLKRNWLVGANPFYLTFLNDTEYDLTYGGRVLFEMTNTGTNDPYTVVVEAHLTDGTTVPVLQLDEPDGDNEFDLNYKAKTLYFDLPAGGTLQGVKLSFLLKMYGEPDHYGNVVVRDFRVTSSAPIAGAPIREVACDGDNATEFDLTSLVSENGSYAEGTVVNKSGGEVNYKDADQAVLLVKDGEIYEFTNVFGKVEIRGTSKAEEKYFDFDRVSDADLVTVTAGDSYGKVAWDQERRAIRSAWDGSRAFEVRFRSDGLVSSEQARILTMGMTSRNNSAAFSVDVTVQDVSGEYTFADTEVIIPAWGSAVFAIRLPAGMPLSNMNLKFVKNSGDTLNLTGFRITEEADGALFADFSESNDKENFNGSDIGQNFSVTDDELLNKSWEKIISEFSLKLALFFTGMEETDGAKLIFDYVRLSPDYTLDVTVNGETKTLSGQTTQEVAFDMSAAEMANFSIDFAMKKGGSLDGYGNLFLDNFRIAFGG